MSGFTNNHIFLVFYLKVPLGDGEHKGCLKRNFLLAMGETWIAKNLTNCTRGVHVTQHGVFQLCQEQWLVLLDRGSWNLCYCRTCNCWNNSSKSSYYLNECEIYFKLWLLYVLFQRGSKNFDRDRTRTCNPLIRTQMPSPLGHTAADMGIKVIVDLTYAY